MSNSDLNDTSTVFSTSSSTTFKTTLSTIVTNAGSSLFPSTSTNLLTLSSHSTSTSTFSSHSASTSTFASASTTTRTTTSSNANEVRDFVVAIVALVFVVIFIVSVVGFICYSLGQRSEKRKQFKREVAAFKKKVRELKKAENGDTKTLEEIESPYSLAIGDETLMIQDEETSDTKKNKKSVKFSKTTKYKVNDVSSNSAEVNESIKSDGLHYSSKGGDIYTLSVKRKGDKIMLVENKEDIIEETENNLEIENTPPDDGKKPGWEDDGGYADISAADIQVLKRRSTPIERNDFDYVDISNLRKSVPNVSFRISNDKLCENNDLSNSILSSLGLMSSGDGDYDETLTVPNNSDLYDSTKENNYDTTEHEGAKRRLQIQPEKSPDNNYDHVELPLEPSIPPKPSSYDNVVLDNQDTIEK